MLEVENITLERDPAFAVVAGALCSGGRVRAGAIPLPAMAFVLSKAECAHAPDVLVVTPTIQQAEDFAGDLKLFSKRPVHVIPPFERPREDGEDTEYDAAVEHAAIQTRLDLLSLLYSDGKREPIYAVCSAEALVQPLPGREAVRGYAIELKSGVTLDIEELSKTLESRKFVRSPMVEFPGEYARRGGIVDVFPFGADAPVRIEFADDRVESLRAFDTATQISMESVEKFHLQMMPRDTLRPAESEGVFLPEAMGEAAAAVLVDEDESKARLDDLAAARPHIAARVFSDLSRQKGGRPTVSLFRLPEPGKWPNFRTTTMERLGGTLAEVTAELKKLAAKYETIRIYCPREAQKERLRELFRDAGLEHSNITLESGRLSGAFSIESAGAAFVPNAELFNRYRDRREGRKARGRAIETYLDLEPGNLVVHASHGIGRYRGMKLIKRHGREQEFLSVEFAECAILYVPAVNIALVQKYVGGRGRTPLLAKLGNKSWTQQKSRVAKAVEDLAGELIEIQVARELAGGFRYGADTPWQREFEASFPFEETPSQELSSDEIKADMASVKPMDRLLCGDVGYGKTEIAMRAAFKAAEHGKQTAVLVPTTLLAEQHIRTFRERMAEYPFLVDALSRFKTAKEQKAVLEKLKEGGIDIVIGTHRMLSDDVFFKDLGLLVIDEEQRFGVMHKEKLKKYRAQVEVLTMTATPIPRTLHLALMGAKDISNLESPPLDRLAVETHVVRYDDQLVREAILYELERGGQTFYVHNRVMSINHEARKLEALIPEASFTVVHGQMEEDLLEDRMIQFLDGKTDVLVTTTIIESGLDIPNVNTLIVNDSHRFGLADLHQLRGRVGRYKRQAYAYFMIPRRGGLTEVARKRLSAIEEMSELGAGFRLAMRDLEIRGAGNVLGREQSGHIAAVGYDLYCQLLETAVRRARRQPIEERLETDIDLEITAYLPDDYIGSEKVKMAMYRRLSSARTVEDAAALRTEMEDRFGTPPAEAVRFIEKAELKILLEERKIWYVGVRAEQLVIRFASLPPVEAALSNVRESARITGPDEIMITLPAGVVTQEQIFDYLRGVLMRSRKKSGG
jgi:transcription-repair coupling factor (superfamily II helicase)